VEKDAVKIKWQCYLPGWLAAIATSDCEAGVVRGSIGTRHIAGEGTATVLASSRRRAESSL
jgi:hypothetical protein